MKLILTSLAILTASVHGQLVITEVMASSIHASGSKAKGDWWELTNTGAVAVDLTGYKWDDAPTPLTPTVSNFPSGTIIQPGESIIILDEPAANVAFWRTAWSLPLTLQVLDSTAFTAAGGNDFSGFENTGDQVNVYGPAGNLVASVAFGISTQGKSFAFHRDGKPVLGLSSVTGEQGATASTLSPSDVGSPGDQTLHFLTAPVQVATASYSYAITATSPGATFPVITSSLVPPLLPSFLTLSVSASGSATLTNNRPLTAADNGDYPVKIIATVGLVSTVQLYTLKVQVPVPAPEISVEQPVSINIADGGSQAFGAVATGSSTSLTFTIRNRGTAPLALPAILVPSITLDGPDYDEFSITTQPALTVAASDGFTTFTVKFAPSYVGTKTAALHIANNDPDEAPYDITLTASAFASDPEIVVEQPAATGLVDGKAKKSFGKIAVGKKSPAKIFTIINTGKADLTGLVITKNGKHAKDFLVTALTKTTVAPNTTATFKVTFKPKAKGARNAAIQIKSNDTDENPFDVRLTGTAGK
jgi:Lamin Tail Domain/Abnormal spindle-like microcephaly-assoc'd, ASPM-SPD-2-Hydin